MNGLGLCALLSARSAYQVINHWYHKHRQNRRGHHAADHGRGNALRHFRPVLMLHMMGSNPATMTVTVIALGRIRTSSTAPSRMMEGR
jgi:hypothetical protein